MQHAARYHISGFAQQNPAYAKKMSEKLEEILQTFQDNWAELEKALREFINRLKEGDVGEFPGLDPWIEVPFVRLMLETVSKNTVCDQAREQRLIDLTLDLIEHIRQEIRRVGFWKSEQRRSTLINHLARRLIVDAGLLPPMARDLAYQLVALAKHNHEALTQ